MSASWQILFDFVWTSACLALVAFSLGLILGELKIVNVAQGDLMMVGAYSMYALRDLPFLVALALTFVFGLALGFALERGVLRWVYDKGFMATLLASWGVGIVLEQTVAAIFTVSQKGVDAPLAGLIVIGSFAYPAYRVAVAAGIIVLLAGLMLLVYRTSAGLRLRASIDNVEMAALMGVSPQRTLAIVFAIATALAVLAGALVAPTLAIAPTMGLSYLAPAFFAVLIAKQGSLAGPIVGAVAVEFTFTLLQAYLNVTLAESILFGLLAIFIAVKPQGVSWSWSQARKARAETQ
jgi:branched-chain amino acid transport system permease protein/urea transport system permease protein